MDFYSFCLIKFPTVFAVRRQNAGYKSSYSLTNSRDYRILIKHQAKHQAAPEVLPGFRVKNGHFPGKTPGSAVDFAGSFSMHSLKSPAFQPGIN